MSAIFISHSSRDAATAAELRDWLLQRRFRSLFLDFDPALGIPAGRNWEQELYRQLRACQAVIVLCSAHSMESDWCFAEITHARALGKTIFPVRIAPCNLRPALTELQVVDAIADRPAAYERLLQGLRTAGLEHLFPWDPRRPPYPGLLAFQEADAAIYFGREPDIRAGLDALNRVRRFGGARLHICLGASGSGKSSLMRAGILPRLKQDPESWLVLPVFRPLHEPIAELAAALAHAMPGDGAPRDWKAIARELEQAAASSAIATKAWGDLLRELRLASPARESVVVFAVDQFEEALTATPQAGRFLALLQALVGNPDSQAVVLATLRSDFLQALQKHPAFRVPFDTLALGPLPVDGLAQVIEGPARVAGIEIESGLAPLLLADTEIEDGLPLLAFTLRKLWERDGATGRLTIATYNDALGGLHGAIAREAEAVAAIDALSDAEQRDLRASFLAMARIDENGQYLRQAVRWTDLPAGIHPLLERFVSARLLVSGSEERERILEVAHEALFRVWKRLKSWLDADRDNLRLREGIRQAANEWNERARSAELLVHRGSRLEAAEALLREARFPLDPMQREYLAACIDAREAAREAERAQALARRRRVRIALASLSLGLLVASALSFWALGERRQATDRLASLHWVNGVTERDSNRDSLKALHHFMQAALTSEEADARSAFFAGELLAGAASLGAIVQPGDGLRGAAFGSDSHHVVTWNGAGSARTWELAAEGSRESPLQEGHARKIAASPRLTWTVLWSGDDAIEVRNSQTARSFVAASSATGMPVFSETESRIAVREGNVVRVWDQSSKTPLAVLEHPVRVVGVALSRRGEQLLTWDSARTARIWNTRSGTPLGELRYATDIQGGAIGDASKQVLLWGKEAPATLWTVGSDSLVALSVDPGNNPSIMGAAFLDRSRRLVAWNYGGIGRARIFDLDRGIELARLAHDGAIRNVVVDRSERLVLTWSDDGTARVWDGNRLALRAILAHNDELRGADFSADESRILTWSADRTARVWDAASGYPLTMPLRHDGVVEGAMFAPDGRSVLSFDQRSARWWPLRVDPESPVYTLRHDGNVVRAAFASADGDVVTFTRDGLLHRWIRGDESEPPFSLPKSLVDVAFDSQRKRMVGWDSSDALGSWDTGHGHALTPMMLHDRSDFGIRGAKTSPDGQRILSWGDDRTARLWDSESGSLLALLRHPGPVVGAELSHDSRRIVTWSEDRIVRVWDAESAKLLVELPANEHGIRGVALTRDAARIVVWDTNGMLRFKDARSGADVAAYNHGTGVAVRGATLSADESRLLTWDDAGLVRIWNSSRLDDAVRVPVVWQAGDVQSAAFAVGERMVLTHAEAGARLWDSRNGQPLSVLFTLGGPMLGALLRPDGRALLAWSEDTARVWCWAVELDATEFDGVARQQVRSGTWLDNMGQVALMPVQQWQAASARAAQNRPAR